MAGDKFPAVDVFHDGKEYYLADGLHRILASQRAKFSVVECIIHQGTLTDAIWFAIGANGKNGLHRSAADKHHAIEMALAKFPEKTQEQIAAQVGCSQRYVSTVQAQLRTSSKFQVPDIRQGKDGRNRPTKYKPRRKSTKALPVESAKQAPSTPPARTASAPVSALAKEDFPARVKASFKEWVEQWAVADFPRVKKIVREILDS